MTTQEQASGKRLVRYNEILQWIVDDYQKDRGLSTIEEIDWIVFASMSQYLFEDWLLSIKKHSEIKLSDDSLWKKAFIASEMDLHRALGVATYRTKESMNGGLVTLTKVIDYIKEKKVLDYPRPTIDFSAFFSSPEYDLVEKIRQEVKSDIIRLRRWRARAILEGRIAKMWYRRCDENRESLSKLTLGILSIATLGILSPKLLWLDSHLLELVCEEISYVIRGDFSPIPPYSGLLEPILMLRHKDYASGLIMFGKSQIAEGLRQILRELR